MLTTTSRSRQVREMVEAAIQDGSYEPGERLPSERELVAFFGVSRVSVREATRSLEAVGLVEVQHGRGCFVAESRSDQYARSFSHSLGVHRDKVLELLKVRGALDELAAESAAVCAGPLCAGRLRELNATFRGAGAGALDTLVGHDVAFHEAIAAASGSPLLADRLHDLHETFNESRRATLRPPGRSAVSADEHDAIIAAVEQGDPEAAREAVAAHVASVRSLLTTLPAAEARADAS